MKWVTLWTIGYNNNNLEEGARFDKRARSWVQVAHPRKLKSSVPTGTRRSFWPRFVISSLVVCCGGVAALELRLSSGAH